MRWHKRGVLIPAPPPHDWAVSHAMVPIAAPRPDGHIRVYFSTRDAESRSHVTWADLELDDPAGAAYRNTPLLRPGPLGAFDDSGAMAASLVRVDGRLHLYYIGWSRGVTVPFTTFIGCAVSDDGGETFERVSAAPVLGRGPRDPYLTTSPWVLFEGGRWRMWYASGTDWTLDDAGRPRHHYRIAYAESGNGIDWARDGHVCVDYANADEYAIARPCVVRDHDRYRMWFCARGDAYRLGYAESSDGYDWVRDDAQVGLEPASSGWDAEMQAYPFVFDHRGERVLLYNGNGYGATGIGHAVLER